MNAVMDEETRISMLGHRAAQLADTLERDFHRWANASVTNLQLYESRGRAPSFGGDVAGARRCLAEIDALGGEHSFVMLGERQNLTDWRDALADVVTRIEPYTRAKER